MEIKSAISKDGKKKEQIPSVTSIHSFFGQVQSV